ncbi:MAG: nucleotidyltransferase family protein [Acutalibacteraceae bacterium]|nr:nucleotidyltransferase family protein [Acutalibacteraceae bacterium]
MSDNALLTEKDFVELLLMSYKHNVAHLIASALNNNGYFANCPQQGQFMNEFYKAVFEQEKLNESLNEVCSVLEEKGIPYISLKGAEIRNLYPQPWMRTSCDIDILVKEKDLKKASEAIFSIKDYSKKGESKHDIVFVSANKTVIELHYKLLANKKSPLYSSVLKDVWKKAEPCDGSDYRYKLSDEIFYYYHILHMAKHFRLGGCGLRPFIDLMLIDNKCGYTAEINKTLKRGKLLTFAESARKLSRVWFGDEEHDETTLQMEKYILEGGIFGSAKTRAESVNQRSGNKVRYMISRLFVPYRYLKRDYPILEKCPFLTPFYEFHRIFSLLFGKKKGFKNTYVNRLETVSKSDYDHNLLDKLGLK